MARLENWDAADLVIEAIPERLALKQALFSQLDELAKLEAILASNTSSLETVIAKDHPVLWSITSTGNLV
ncbi:hypothetical protein JIR001_23660 [Polycladomyces abyssicola]|uniref:3-hydroxyacyl-CoA dehydrogenase NAD binding domain-containing protein n=2 Tax=Polycladomyces abyssicola TaxID=1125966 RepID=A0A8D5UI88_9BACL|nr:hypothetical protein JIR001_23660 [Polycladomyces abyssicola]